MRIRKARKEDVVKMSNLKRKTFEKVNSRDYPPEVIKEYSLKQTHSKMRDYIKNGNVFLLTEKDRVLGRVDSYENNILRSLFLHWSMVGKGYEKKILDYVQKYAKKKGEKKLVSYLIIMTKRFYLKNRYNETKEFTFWNVANKRYKIFKMETKLK